MNRSQTSTPIVIVTAADHRYGLPLGVTLASLIINTSEKERLQIHILDGGTTPRQKRRIMMPLGLKRNQLHFYDYSQLPLPHPKKSSHLSVSTSLRFMIPQILPSDCQKVIYLDTDTVVTGDIAQLWKLPSEDYACSGVLDTFAPRADSPYGIQQFQKLTIPPETKCLNAGVLLINLEKWRDEEISARAIDFLKNHCHEMNLVSQEALNSILAGCWGEIPGCWNQLINPLPYLSDEGSVGSQQASDRRLEEEETQREPGILHFITSYKPWLWGYPHPLQKLYFDYIDQTDWCGFRPRPPTRMERIRSAIEPFLQGRR